MNQNDQKTEERLNYFKKEFERLLFMRFQNLASIFEAEDEELKKLTYEFAEEFVNPSAEYKDLLAQKGNISEEEFHDEYIKLIELYIKKHELFSSNLEK